jgi:hypothetical protein
MANSIPVRLFWACDGRQKLPISAVDRIFPCLFPISLNEWTSSLLLMGRSCHFLFQSEPKAINKKGQKIGRKRRRKKWYLEMVEEGSRLN